MTPRRQRAAGFTLIETLVAMAITAILSSVAYPSYQTQLLKARRADALVAVHQVQMAQERWRANHPGYAAIADLALASTSPRGHYAIAVASIDRHHYEVTASASGTQANDGACSHLRLTVDGGNVLYASGADATVGNGSEANRRCWSL